MSLKSTLLHVLGAVAGILIPGASASVTNLIHTVQQHLGDLYGAAAVALARELAVDTTGMSGPDKIFAITKAIVATAKADGFSGDLKVLERVALDVAQSAFRAAQPTIEADVIALAAALTSNPLAKVATTLIFERVGTALIGAA